MKREDLLAQGLTEEQAAFVMAENEKDIGHTKEEATSVTLERDGLRAQLAEVTARLDALSGIDKDAQETKINELTAALATQQAEYQAKLAAAERQRENEAFFHALPQKFINDETRHYYSTKLEELLNADASRGKSRQELLDSLIKDEKGEVRPHIFAPPQNPHRENTFPPVGSGGGTYAGENPFQKGEHFNMKEQTRLFRENPELARYLAKQAGQKIL